MRQSVDYPADLEIPISSESRTLDPCGQDARSEKSARPYGATPQEIDCPQWRVATTRHAIATRADA
jgi:hypothetical protein